MLGEEQDEALTDGACGAKNAWSRVSDWDDEAEFGVVFDGTWMLKSGEGAWTNRISWEGMDSGWPFLSRSTPRGLGSVNESG